MQFGYDAPPSFWQEVKSNSHLVIAAVGTAALLGVAGTALWLAMPDGDRRAFAQVEKPSPDVNAEVKAAGPPSQTSTASKPADGSTATATDASDPSALAANDARWSGKVPKQAHSGGAGVAEVQKEAATPPIPTPEQAAAVAAYQSAMKSPDGDAAHAKPDDEAETAAIPTPRPAAPSADDDAVENGHILRAVTMRSGPKKSASALRTIPARAAVHVMSCESWCEIEYEGKRGWIYKSFLKRG
jgi:hypothetical protein